MSRSWACGALPPDSTMLDPVASNGVSVSLNGRRALLPLQIRNTAYEANGNRLVDVPDLRLGDHGIAVIMGPNAAGKSVLLRLMHGLIKPTDGEILWGEKRMDRELARRKAMVFQKPVLLRRSAAANIWHALALRGIARGDRPDRVDGALKLAGLAGRGAAPARVLSGGEQQRLCLARALRLDPSSLF